MPTRDSTLRINVDVDRASAKARKLAQDLKIIGQSGKDGGVQVQSGMNQAERAIQSASDQSAAAAVRFQTMTNGMLNLSTAGIQTFTSISNLDRAMNRAKASAVSFERAEDLLARKQFMLNEEMKKSEPNYQKIALLRGELATATNDLAVKEEKLRIEQSAVLDVQLLFFANIMNVGVSSMQVFATMIGAETAAMIKSTIATKLKSVATWENFRASRAAQLGSTGLAIGLGAEVAAHTGASIATRLHTAALTGLKIALGPIGLIFIGISAAMAAYETNALGLKDTINGLMGVQDDYADSTNQAKFETEQMIQATSGLNREVGKIPDSYTSARIAMEEYRKKLVEVSTQQALVNSSKSRIGDSLPLSLSGFSRASPPEKDIFEKISSFLNFVPSAHADNTPFIPRTISSTLQDFSVGSNVKLHNQFGITFGTAMDKELDQTAFGFAYMELFTNSPDFRRGEIERAKLLKLSKQLQGGSKFMVDIPDYSKEFDPSVSGNFLIPDELSNFKFEEYYMATRARAGLTGPLSKENRRIVKDINRKLNIGVHGLNTRELSKKLLELSSRDYVDQVIGFDIGAVASSMNRSNAINTAILEKRIRMAGHYNHIFGTNSQNFQSAVNSGLSATALFQVPKGSINVPQWVKDEIEERDRISNLGLPQLMAIASNILGGNKPVGSLSRSASKNFQKNFSSLLGITGNTFRFGKILGGDEESDLFMSELRARFPEVSSNRGARDLLYEALAIADSRINRVEGTLSSIGIDVDFNAPMVLQQVYWGSRKHINRFKWVSSKDSPLIQIMKDLGASSTSYIPSIDRLEDITRAFNDNGRFTNFNDIGITSRAMAGLNLSERSVFDIRFNATRGDRELLNRLRHMEMLQSASSGTSPL